MNYELGGNFMESVKLTFTVLLAGFFAAGILGQILIPILRRLKFGQQIREDGPTRHAKKAGTPTIGGLIFIFATLIAILLLWYLGYFEFNYNILIIFVVFLGYATLGFLDDFLKIKKAQSEGLTIIQKLIGQLIIALLFYYIWTISGNDTVINIHTLNININLGWLYGLFLLFMLVGTSNAVNITDGLDGLTAGLCVIAFMTYGLIAWRAVWISGNSEIALFCFAVVGSLMGFLIYNAYPAKVFMGDTGSLALGGVLAAIAVITQHELTLIVVGGVFVIEVLSDIIQIIVYKTTGRRVFLMAPLHHHFELLGWNEVDIVRFFWIIGFIFGVSAIVFGAIL